MYTSAAVAGFMDWVRAQGPAGVGQGSWGPTGFAILPSDAEARRLIALAQQARSIRRCAWSCVAATTVARASPWARQRWRAPERRALARERYVRDPRALSALPPGAARVSSTAARNGEPRNSNGFTKRRKALMGKLHCFTCSAGQADEARSTSTWRSMPATEVVVPYCGVTLDEITGLTQDAIFSRGPKGVKATGIFIGGRDVMLAADMLDAARKAMVPPFEVSVIADPSGSYTTAAALVACVEQVLRSAHGTDFARQNGADRRGRGSRR